jgi:hypothetical protein
VLTRGSTLWTELLLCLYLLVAREARAEMLPVLGRLDFRNRHGENHILPRLVIHGLIVAAGLDVRRIDGVASARPHPIGYEQWFAAKLQTVLAIADEHGRNAAQAVVGFALGVTGTCESMSP